MMDNFNTHKWFKDKYLEESKLNESEWLGPEQIQRFEGTANMRDLKTLQDMLRIVSADWMQEGFDKEDIKEYVSNFIDQI